MGRPSRQRRSFVAALVLSLLAGFGVWAPGASALPAAAEPPSESALAAPELGGQLFATGARVEVQVLPASAGFTSELWLFEPGPERRLATNRDVGLVVDLGTFPAGVELVFGIKVLNTGQTFKMGPGARNPDGIPHAIVDFLEPGRAHVGFEDLFGGGDRDYNDNMFEFRGGIIEEPPSGPTADAGPDQTVDEGAVVTLDATASTDPDSQNLTYAWALTGHVGPPITLSSSTSTKPTFQSTDDGRYTFTLTVSDGTETDSDEVVITVRNRVPVLAAQADPAYAGGVALVTTSFTDAGILDTHAGTLGWGDGSEPEAVPVSAQGTGWGTLVASHVYEDPGSYTVTITITDDDGGAASTTVAGLQVIVPVALWANSSGTDAAMESTSGAVTVVGLTHTNDDLRIRGGAKSFTGPTEYVRTLDVGGAGATFTPPAVRTGIKPFPIRFPIADYRPGGRAAIEAGAAYHDMSASCGSDGFWHVVGSTLASGIYYTTCGVKLNGNPLGGTITVAAEGDIQVSGSGAFFDPYIDGLLFVSYSTSTNAVRVDASGSTFFGYSFAERGRIAITGAGDRFYCGILGDRIDIAAQDLRVQGSGCTRPARTIAPPTLVPTLSVDVTVDRADVLPGGSLTHSATVTNGGATLVVPGVIGIENLGTAQVTVTGHTLGLEYLSATDGAWHPLPGDLTITVRPNAITGVAYPSGAETIDGTTAQPGALASWGYAAVVRLTAAQVTFLLDPAQVTAVRNVSTFTVAPATAPVRRLFRFGDDFVGQLRTLGADATNVVVTIVPPAGDAAVFNATTTPSLAVLTPGEAVTVSRASTVPAPAERADDETDAAYRARLASFDLTLLVGTAFARGSAGIGPVLAPADLATSTRHLPVVGLDKTGPASIEAGSTAQYALALENSGSAEARDIVLTDAIAGIGARPVSGAPATLAPAAAATATASYPVPANATQSVVNTGTVRWSDTAGNDYGPLNDALTTIVIAPRKLAVVKTDVTTPGSGASTISYEIAVTNLGDQPVTGVVVSDTPDALTSLVVGSVTTTAGTVTSGNTSGDTAVAVSIGTLAGRTTQVVAFDTVVGFVPEGVASVSNQATVTSVELPPIVSDDPGQPGATDPTTTPVGPTAGGGGGGGEARPTIGAPTPADGSVVTEPVTISAAIAPPEGQSIASWKITASRASTSGETVLATGSGAGVDEAVTASAAFDPTMLPNGTYLITIRSTASGGGIQMSTTSLIVDGNLKLGRYVTTYLDLSVGVAGLPMQVLRTYDSFDKAVGDFGVGWNVELANFRVSVNKPLGYGGWVQETFGCGFIFCQTRYRTTIPHTVTVVWPDGHQEIFDLTPANGSTFFAPATAAGFTGRTGTTSTLQADGDTSLSYFGDGNLYGGGFGSGGLYDPQRFRLTDKFGTRYLLEVGHGLISSTDRAGNTLTVSDSGIQSSRGPAITFTRDPAGRISQVTDPLDGTIRYGYDAAGDLVSVTDQNDDTVVLGYLPGHYLATVGENGKPPIRTLNYGPDGRLDSVTDGEGNSVTLNVDVDQGTETITGPDPRLTTINAYDDDGNLARLDQLFQGHHLVTTSTFNDDGLPLVVTDPSSHQSTAEYDAKKNLKRFTDRDDVVTEIDYNTFNQPTEIRVGGELQARYRYDDATGDLIRIELSDDDVVRFTYDHGDLASIIDASGHSQSFGYDALGFLDEITGPDGTTTIVNDEAGRRLSQRDPLGGVTEYEYDATGNLKVLTDANDHVRRFEYDIFGRITSEGDALTKATTYTYDDAGRLATRRDRTGVTTTYTYGPDGQLTSRSATDGSSETRAYDGLGRLVTARNAISELTFGWDDASLPTSETLAPRNGSGIPSVTIGIGSTPEGRTTSITDPYGTTTYDFDPLDRLAAISDSQAGAFSFAYDELDRLAQLGRPNGVNDVYTYANDRLGSLVSKLGATVLNRADYTFDASGNPATITDIDGVHAYDHDALGRLTSATHPTASGLSTESYVYDAVGNRRSWSGNPAASVSYDNANRLRSDATYTYVYDDAGRLKSRTPRAGGVATTLEWNAFDQLVAVNGPGGRVDYRYDALGRRIETAVGATKSRIVYHGPNPRLVFDGTNQLQARLVEGLGLDGVLALVGGTGVAYPLADSSATVDAVTDAAGTVTQRFRYDSFGRPSASTTPSSPHAWQGLAPDPTGWSFARARTYDPAVGRFLSEDPIPTNNLYPYVSNAPLNLSDPTGLMAVEYSANTSNSARTAPQVCSQGMLVTGMFADLATDIVFTSAIDLVLPAGGGLYSFFDKNTGQSYVGRSADLRARILAHLRSGRVDPSKGLRILGLKGAVLDNLRVAEQLAIRDCGGVRNLANKINGINRQRADQIEELYQTLEEFLRTLT